MEKNTAVSASNQMAGMGAQQGYSSGDVSALVGAVKGGQTMGELNATQNLATELGKDSSDIRALTETSQAISMTDKTVAGARSLSQGRVLEAGPGSLAGNALEATTVDTRQWVASNKISKDMASTIQSNTRGSEQESFDDLAQFTQTGVYSQILATDGNANGYLATIANSQSLDLARKEALIDRGIDLGLSPQKMGNIFGDYEAAQASGKALAMDSLSPAEIAFGYYANHLRHATHADQMQRVAAEQDMDLESFMATSQGMEASKAMANYLKTDAIARQLNESNTDAMLRQQGAQTVVTVSGDTAKAFAQSLFDQNAINERQYDWMITKSEAGETIHASYSMDLTAPLEPGTVGNVALRTGNTAAEETSIRTTSGTQDIALESNHLAAFQAFTGQNVNNPGQQALRDGVYQDFDTDGQLNDVGTITALNNLNKAVSEFGQVRLSDYDSSRGEIHAGMEAHVGGQVEMDTSKSWLGWLGEKAVGTRAKASVGASGKLGGSLTGSTGSTEDFSVSQFNQMAIEHMTNTLGQINTEMVAQGLNLHATDPLDRNDAEQYRDERFVASMQTFIGEYISDMQAKASHNLADSDESGLLKSGFGQDLLNKVNDSDFGNKFDTAAVLK
jgi:hypothetical protein